MKVLFIDDEPLIRRGFQAIIPWQKYGFNKFYEAEDGQEGIHKIIELCPELVLLDIRMRDLDGIEVAKRVRESGFKGRIVIISGYSDFEYAKSAISYDVTAYLLKPVDTKELVDAMMKAKEELEKESLLSVYAGQPIKQSVTNVISDIITGRLKYTSDIKLAYGIELSSTFYRLIAIHSLINDDNLEARKDFLSTVKKHNHYMVLINGDIYLLLTSKEGYNEYINLQKDYLTNLKGSEFYFFQSDTIRNIQDLPLYYNKLKHAIDKLFYLADDTYNYLCPLNLPEYNIQNFNILSQTQAILNTILTLNNNQLVTLISEYSTYLSVREVARDSIGFMIGNSYQQIITELFTHYPQMELFLPNHKNFMAKLPEFMFLYEYIEYFKKQLLKMISFIIEEENRNPCKNLCQYIESNYSSFLKLENIAAQFGYNSSYLGKIFKKETGESFNTYLDRIRIKYAKEHLKKNASVSQTAASVGFSDIDYFTKKFRKYENCTPSEFKKRNCK
jgi:two-component system response regulator YesN